MFELVDCEIPFFAFSDPPKSLRNNVVDYCQHDCADVSTDTFDHHDILEEISDFRFVETG